MSTALRLTLALPLLAAMAATAVGHAATSCPQTAAQLLEHRLARDVQARALEFASPCTLDCAREAQADAAQASARETHAPLPLWVVTRAADVADWHAQIFERLSARRSEESPAYYCGISPRLRNLPL